MILVTPTVVKMADKDNWIHLSILKIGPSELDKKQDRPKRKGKTNTSPMSLWKMWDFSSKSKTPVLLQINKQNYAKSLALRLLIIYLTDLSNIFSSL